jgi:hypothetical protein
VGKIINSKHSSQISKKSENTYKLYDDVRIRKPLITKSPLKSTNKFKKIPKNKKIIISFRSATPVSTATGGVGSSTLSNLGGSAGLHKNRKTKKKGPQGPVTGSKYPKLNYKCTGFWKEDHNQVT